MKTSVAFLVSGLAAQQVSATWNLGAKHFNTPQYNNNECSEKQKGGFNWGDLPTGNFNNYGDFSFKGGSGSWSCANSFGKRDALTKRTFNSKCIKNKVKKDKPANFDCGDKKKDGFSVKEIEVSVEYDCDLEFHYKMPDNSICKQVKRCSKEGTLVKNTQCGGAKSVDVYLGKHEQKSRDDCEIGFHRIDFDCNPGYTPTKKPSQPPPSQPASSKPASSKPASSYPASLPPSPPSSKPASSTPAPSAPASSAPASSAPASSAPASSAPASSAPASSKPISSYPASLPPQTTSKPAETPKTGPPSQPTPPSTYATHLPYGNSSTPIGSKPYTPPSVPGTSSGAVASSSQLPVPSSPPKPEVPGYTPPECLPKCLNTWLEIKSDCKDNTDSNCYCKNPDFTKDVIECVAAWSKNDKETQEALQYLIGICAPQVPQNPGLITNCPSNIPLNPTSPATPTGAPSGSAPAVTPAPSGGAPPAGPVTQITYKTTVTVPCGCGVPGSSIVSTISTAITVPQVVFTTNTPAQPPAPGVTPTEQPVALVPGTPTAVPAITTGAPYPTGGNGVPTFGTITIPGRNGTASPTRPAQFTGAASSVVIGFQPALFGAILAFFAL
ncbi:hypothetical protein B0J11DRAFT_29102 [Dendryphion nanum]|uniref:CFEM domain-containing protein n=1 Tax=Dendryphion nanum TaxID=256645 RepID=A0A9P9J1Q4_9PLEO|nr:hypothetical protein B0J11DRAFT_29102 [Dendryphion nanum]